MGLDNLQVQENIFTESFRDYISREYKAAKLLAKNAEWYPIKKNGNTSKVAMVLPGQAAPPVVYLGFARSLEEYGIQGVVGRYRNVATKKRKTLHGIFRGGTKSFENLAAPVWNSFVEFNSTLLDELPSFAIDYNIAGLGSLSEFYSSARIEPEKIREFEEAAHIFNTFFLPSWNRPYSSLEKITNYVKREYGGIDFSVGHSIGGTSGLRIVPREVKINRNFIHFAVSSPIFEIEKWQTIRLGEKFGVLPEPLVRENLERITEEARPYKDNIVTIRLECDRIVPPRNSRFSGARDYVLTKKDLKQDEPEELFSHTGCIYMKRVKEIILEEINTAR